MRTTSLARSVVVVSLVILGTTPGLAQAPPGGSGASPAQPAPTSFLAPARATWESTRLLVLGLIEAMPEDKYDRSEEHTSELQSRGHLVCRLLLEKKKKKI